MRLSSYSETDMVHYKVKQRCSHLHGWGRQNRWGLSLCLNDAVDHSCLSSVNGRLLQLRRLCCW